MNAKDTYKKLMELKDQYPDLVLKNDGYQYLRMDIRESHKDIIKEIENLLIPLIPRFREFNNFKPRENGTFAIRCQYGWDQSFTGVGYFEESDFMSETFDQWNKDYREQQKAR